VPHQARDEMAREARKLLAEAAAKELKGEEGVKLLKAFRDEAKAAEGDGGDVWVVHHRSQETSIHADCIPILETCSRYPVL
jgi:hypothetical protein